MPRIRTIKPEFFQHEALYDAERSSGFPLRIAFAGLWVVADKAGRFEWRPRQIKLNVLPYDSCDFADVLAALQQYGFVEMYEVDGKQFGRIPSWLKHQHINIREPPSTIPPAAGESDVPDEAGESTGQVPDQSAGKGREGKGKEGEREGGPVPGLDATVWDRWTNYRTKIRRPLKPVSILAAQRELAAFGASQAAVVEQSIANGWQGLFELKGKAAAKVPPQPKQRTEPTPEAITAAQREAMEQNKRQLQKVLGDVIRQ